jgi:hypothetical protein
LCPFRTHKKQGYENKEGELEHWLNYLKHDESSGLKPGEQGFIGKESLFPDKAQGQENPPH